MARPPVLLSGDAASGPPQAAAEIQKQSPRRNHTAPRGGAGEVVVDLYAGIGYYTLP